MLGGTITTATDIYSLGVLLYLLVSGVPPYALQEFTTAEMLRRILKTSFGRLYVPAYRQRCL